MPYPDTRCPILIVCYLHPTVLASALFYFQYSAQTNKAQESGVIILHLQNVLTCYVQLYVLYCKRYTVSLTVSDISPISVRVRYGIGRR